MDAITAIKTRRSVRSFTDKPIPRDVIEDIVDCGRLAATGINVQPWEFIVVTDADTRKRLAETANNGKFIAQAPACIAVFSDDTKYFLEDCSAATQNILVAAWAHGVGSCWVAGDKKDYCDTVRELLGVPKPNRLVSLIALGYPTQPPGEKSKRSLNEVIHWEKW